MDTPNGSDIKGGADILTRETGWYSRGPLGKLNLHFPTSLSQKPKDSSDRKDFRVFPYVCLADLEVLCPSRVEGLGIFCTEESYNQGREGGEGHQGDSVKYA